MTLLDFGDWKITLREATFAFLIVGIMTFAGYFIAGEIEQQVHSSQLRYRRALQIDKDPSQFSWALRTDVGDAFVEGQLEVVDPVSHELLGGKWMKIQVACQKYQMHTKRVTYRTADGKTRIRTKTYWTWDTYDSKELSATRAEFLGEKLKLSDLDICGTQFSEKVVKTGSNKRIVFSMLPTKYNGTMFTTIENKKISGKTPFWVGLDLASAYKHCTSSCSVLVFWIVWCIITISIVLGFFVLENDWLEN